MTAERLQELPLREVLHPRVTPELGFQAYESFESDTKKRDAAIAEFLHSDVLDFPLEYTKLGDDRCILTKETQALESLLGRCDEIEDPLVQEITYSSAAFRLAEMHFVKIAARLNRFIAEDADHDVIMRTVEYYKEANEMLYGTPNPEVYEQIRGDIWAVIDHKELHPSALVLKDELENGFEARGVSVRPLERSEKRLPTLDQFTIDWTRERILDDFGHYYELVQSYWDDVIVLRAELEGATPVFDPKLDMLPLFEQSLAMLDPEGTSGITIVENPATFSMSWDTPSQSVKVGTAERPEPIKSVDEAFGKLYHELIGVHGNRTVNGLATDAPIAGFGVFSDFEPGESPDYLTFEEGQAILSEAIIRGTVNKDPVSQWTADNIKFYTYISLASIDGRSMGELFEVVWRYDLLMSLEEGQEVTQAMIDRAQLKTARSLTRVKRAVPFGLPEEAGTVTFNKDLSYFDGLILKAVPVLTEIAHNNDVESFRNLQRTKTDPTNRRQREFAEKVGFPVNVGRE